MSELFNFLTFPLGLPIDPFWSYVIMLIVGEVAYRIAYNAVGKMYSGGEIHGSLSGSGWHWVIRVPVFLAIWAVLYGIISLIKLIIAYWQVALFITSGVLALIATILVVLAVRRQRS